MDIEKMFKSFKDWMNSPKFKPIQLIFLVTGLVLLLFTYTSAFDRLEDWGRFAVFAIWSLCLLLSGVSMGSVKQLVEKGMAIFTDTGKPLEQKYDELFDAFIITAREFGLIFTQLNKQQGIDPNKIKTEGKYELTSGSSGTDYYMETSTENKTDKV